MNKHKFFIFFKFISVMDEHVINRLWHGIFHIVHAGIIPRPISALAYRLGLIWESQDDTMAIIEKAML